MNAAARQHPLDRRRLAPLAGQLPAGAVDDETSRGLRRAVNALAGVSEDHVFNSAEAREALRRRLLPAVGAKPATYPALQKEFGLPKSTLQRYEHQARALSRGRGAGAERRGPIRWRGSRRLCTSAPPVNTSTHEATLLIRLVITPAPTHPPKFGIQ